MPLKNIQRKRPAIFIIFFWEKRFFIHCQHKSAKFDRYVYKTFKEKKATNENSEV